VKSDWLHPQRKSSKVTAHWHTAGRLMPVKCCKKMTNYAKQMTKAD